MTFKETIFFVGKCLTLAHFSDRTDEIRRLIRSGAVDWEQVVWVSTGHFVFSALYLQLKRAGLLDELPADLVEYMEEFTGLNRERNNRIIDQAREITALLNEHGITPVFLKGTAHLLGGLYEDIAERMVGDIDLLVGESEMVIAAEALISNGYEPLVRYNPRDLKVTKHYPRLVNCNLEAAVEIHRHILQFPYDKSIDCQYFIKCSKKLYMPLSAAVLSDEHLMIHNILNVQLNDHGYYYAGVFLRQSYDLLLLSQRENPLAVVMKFGKYFHRMNANLAITNKLLGNPDCIPYEPDWQSNLFLRRIKRHFTFPRWARLSRLILYLLLRISNYTRVLIRLTYDKDTRSSLYTRLSDPKWYGAHIRSYKEFF